MNDDSKELIIKGKFGIVDMECLYLMEVSDNNKLFLEPIVFILN